MKLKKLMFADRREVIDLLIQNPIFYGMPLWLLIFYLTTIIYLYLLSYLMIWVYDKVLKGVKK